MSEAGRGSEEYLTGSARVEAGRCLDEVLAGSARAEAGRADESIGGIVLPDEPMVVILIATFAVTKSSIAVSFTTSADAGCQVLGALYDPDEMIFETWHENLTEHGTAHEHAKSGLAMDTRYAVRLVARTDEGAIAYAPGVEGYYVVKTADNNDAGGGMRFIVF